MQRIEEVLREIGGPNVNWGAASTPEVWAIEQRTKHDEVISRRLLVASWALVVVTVALVVATVGLIFAAGH